MKIFYVTIITLLILGSSVLANEMSGVPSITDGDTIKFFNKRMRLHVLMLLKKNKFVLKILKNIIVEKKQQMH